MVMNKAMEPNANHVNSVNLAGDEKNANRDFNPEAVGREFIRQYYTMLNHGPESLFRFYSNDSSLIHGNEPGESVAPVYGQLDINKKLLSLNFRDCHTKIRQMDSLETVNKSVVIQVIGELSNNGQPMRRFFQTFILSPRSPTHYYVRNDIFRYQDEVFVDDDEGYTEENLVDDGNHVIENTTIDVTDSATGAVVLNSSLVVSSAATAVVNNQPPTPGKVAGQLVNNGDKLNGQLSEQEKLSSEHLERTKSGAASKFSCMNPEISPINAASAPSADASEHLETDDHSDSEQSIDSKFKQSDKAAEPTAECKDGLSSGDEPLKSDQEAESGSVSVLVEQPEKQNEPRTYATMLQKHGKWGGGLSSSSSTPVVNSIDKNKDGQLIRSNEESLVNTVLSNNLGSLHRKDDYTSDWTFESNHNESSSHSAHSEKRNGRDHSDEQQVFVGNLPQNIDENQLRDYFIEYGEIVDVRICQKQGKTPNYGFITFSEHSVVKKILSKKPIYFNNHRINVEEKRSQSGRGSGSFGRGKDKESSSKFNSSNGGGSLSAFHLGGTRASDRNRGFAEKRKGAAGSTNSNNSGNSRAQQSNFNRR